MYIHVGYMLVYVIEGNIKIHAVHVMYMYMHVQYTCNVHVHV